MNKNLKIVLLIMVILAALTFIFTNLYTKKEVQYYNKVSYTLDTFILNKTPMTYADTVLAVGLKVLEIKPKIVVLRPFQEPYNPDDVGDLQAYVYGIDNQYVIWTKDFSRKRILEILSHELIHIKQMEIGILQATDSTVTYRGQTYNNNTIPSYTDRPWEKDAEDEGYVLRLELDEILLQK